MAKHVKFYSGHTVKEWETKYKKQIAKGKIKVFNNEKDLIDFAYYWKIDDKYYQVPNIFEWYNKSLRKSVGLTVALTGTSILATFFLVAALVQSQVKWNEDQGYTISFYADEGTFDGGSKTRTISGIKKGTKFGDVRKSSKYKNPSKNDYEFKHWHVDDDKETPTEFPDDTKITSNVSLKAYYELNPRDPVNFATDSWETVLSIIEKGKDKFIDTYCKDQPTYATDREEALRTFMDSPTNWRTISVGDIEDYGVRLIGAGQDKLSNPDEESANKDVFTFEFNECVAPLPYSYTQGGTPYYTNSGSEDPTVWTKEGYCGLKTFTEDIIMPQLPQIIREHMKTVKKRTLQIHQGLKYKYNKNLQSYEFETGCLDGTYEDPETGQKQENNKLEIVETDEKLFSLSLDEIGATAKNFTFDYQYYNEETKEIELRPGLPLMQNTIQAQTKWGDSGQPLETKRIGEGFEDEQGNFTKPYLFYTKDWDDKEQHKSYEYKRMKAYFIGDGTERVNTQYRLRSIYIPNEYDVDIEGEGKVSGNKDYRPFETWNINDDGSIGNYKSSPIPEEGPYKCKHFASGDMAWASIFVAPAFCL